jgi:hypothetical protein
MLFVMPIWAARNALVSFFLPGMMPSTFILRNKFSFSLCCIRPAKPPLITFCVSYSLDFVGVK